MHGSQIRATLKPCKKCITHKGGLMLLELTTEQIIALKRRRGELNLSVVELSKQIGVSKYVLYRIFNGKQYNVYPSTFKKLNDWIIDQYTTIK